MELIIHPFLCKVSNIATAVSSHLSRYSLDMAFTRNRVSCNVVLGIFHKHTTLQMEISNLA